MGLAITGLSNVWLWAWNQCFKNPGIREANYKKKGVQKVVFYSNVCPNVIINGLAGHRGELQFSPEKKKICQDIMRFWRTCNPITFNFSVTVLLIIMTNISKGEVSIFCRSDFTGFGILAKSSISNQKSTSLPLYSMIFGNPERSLTARS